MKECRVPIVEVQILDERGRVPLKASEDAAGLDLYACTDDDDVFMLPGTTTSIGTGIAVSIPRGYFGAVFARSGIALRKGLRPANCVGVIDADYRGELIVPLHNDTDKSQVIHLGERIAQLVILPCPTVEVRTVENLGNTQRGTGGFGSTGA